MKKKARKVVVEHYLTKNFITNGRLFLIHLVKVFFLEVFETGMVH